MFIDSAFVLVIAVSLIGLVLSVVIERLMLPRPSLMRPWAAWALHAGLWFSAYAALTLVLGRPWFAAAVALALLLVLVLVNNAKFKALREPFIFQDYEYFTDAIRHPRLYIPFLGWGKFFIASSGFVLAVAVGLWIEDASPFHFAWEGPFGAGTVLFAAGLLLLRLGSWKTLPVSFEPIRDSQVLGLLAAFFRYAQEERHPPAIVSPFNSLPLPQIKEHLPHLVAVQSESFFDPRTLYSGIRADILAEFDRLRSDAVRYGKLKVPAWGANTVRTEFAFLTGICEDGLGVHRFNPYRSIASGWTPASLVAYLKRLGYRTLCIHPYPASFYQRDKVFPRLDFDEFIDIRAFEGSMRYGPYMSDMAVAEKVIACLQGADQPIFIFVITMENHGPLHLEEVSFDDVAALYTTAPPEEGHDLTVYLRHLRNADRMISTLRQALDRCGRPASLCWYGDHVPIMPSVYERLGYPDGEVDYVIWNNRPSSQGCMASLKVHDLSIEWLKCVGIR